MYMLVFMSYNRWIGMEYFSACQPNCAKDRAVK